MPDWKAVKIDNEWSVAELVKLGDAYPTLMEDEDADFFPPNTSNNSLAWCQKDTTAYLGVKGEETEIIGLS